MKNLLLISALAMQFIVASGQKSIDKLFDKYSGRDGFTTVNISGNLLNFAASMDDEDDDDNINARITGIRVLTQNDKSMEVENFLDAIKRDLNFNDYEEFMRVKESDQDMRMLVKTEGRKITEFLLVSGGRENSLIQVKGDMTIKDAKRLSENAKKHHDFSLSMGNH
jgi:hypothetical protein